MELIKSLNVLGVSPTVWSHWWKEYNQPHRWYHTLNHIKHMFNLLLPADATKEMIAAIWLHDIVYFPGRSDNEERSAEQAKIDLEGLDINLDLVVETILGSKRHEPGSDFQNVFNDLDLAILGAGTREYDFYSQKIRLEYIDIPDKVYIPGRIKVLKSFLHREPIFQTIEFFRRFEYTAVLNIQREINSLEASLRTL